MANICCQLPLSFNVDVNLYSHNTPLIIHAGIAAGVGIAFSRVCLPVCPRSNRKTA